MVEKRKTKPKRKVKKKQPTQKQKQTQRQNVVVNINTKDLVKKRKRKPRANVNSNTNRVLSQFSPQRSIVIPGNMINPSISGNMINPPTIPQMPMSNIFNPPPTFNKPVFDGMLNPNPLQMGRNTDSVKLTGNVLGDVEREIKARNKYLEDEQSLSGFSTISGLTEDSMDRLSNYPKPPSTTGNTFGSYISTAESINPLTFYSEPDTYANLGPPADFSLQSFKTEPTLSTQTFKTESTEPTEESESFLEKEKRLLAVRGYVRGIDGKLRKIDKPKPKKRKPLPPTQINPITDYFVPMGSEKTLSDLIEPRSDSSSESLGSSNFRRMKIGQVGDEISELTAEIGMAKPGDDLSDMMSRIQRERDSVASMSSY
tara:strand:- start:454 stop:1566 length:1113 start_codon:yes stop_codon:yes gene_type:complete